MTDISQVIRWNTNFVRGLAQSVLERAKVIRSGLNSYSATELGAAAVKKTKATKKVKRKTTTAKKKTPAKARTRRRG